MASNPFLSSPFALPEIAPAATPKPVEAAQFDEAPAQAPARRGMAPTKQDLVARAQQMGVDPALALSFFTQESSGNWNPKDSPKGARGGMQVMPGTYKAMMGTSAGQNDPWMNMEAGLRYISYGQKKLGTKDPELLAAGYHSGYDRKELKAGRIPATNDGMISTADYARSVAARVRGSRQPASQQPNLADQFTDTPEAAVSPAASDFVDSLEEAKGEGSGYAAPQVQAAPGGQAAAIEPVIDIENKPYLDRLTEETKSGFGDMTRSLTTARWALGAGDAKSLAEDLAKAIQDQAAKPKTKAQQEIDAAYQGVTDAKGVIDTTAAGAKALWASLTNPKETSIEIARNAANSLPTLGAGAAGAAAGGAAGSVIPGAGTLSGAIAGGRTGMALGTTATELGAEIQDMVQKRLETAKQPPTAQNVLAILSDKDFQSQALKQGAAKGLTVAAVDQLFMGLGGKIATAPARKVATKELAEQGMDMATRAGRKAVLASPAGQAAIAAAKPTLGARARAGAAAVGVDAAGESLGEGLSQQVARGEVEYGEALREGVTSFGQSTVQTAVGATVESAKVAARAARGAMQPTAAAPSTASGPLARATENAAAEPERVTVTAPDGQVTGTVTGQSEGGVQVVGDDGQVYHFATGPNGVQITPEAPNTPLSNAVEVAAGEAAPAEVPQAPAANETQRLIQDLESVAQGATGDAKRNAVELIAALKRGRMAPHVQQFIEGEARALVNSSPVRGPVEAAPQAAPAAAPSETESLTPQEKQEYARAKAQSTPVADPLGELRGRVRTGTQYTGPQDVQKTKDAVENAWLELSLASDNEQAKRDGGAVEKLPTAALRDRLKIVKAEIKSVGKTAETSAMLRNIEREIDRRNEAEQNGQAIEFVDSKVRSTRIRDGLQNILDKDASNTVQIIKTLDESLQRIGESGLSEAERSAVVRVADAYFGFRESGETAPLPQTERALADTGADNSSMEALIPERGTKKPQPQAKPKAAPTAKPAAFAETKAEALAAPESAPVTQSAPPVETTEEGAGASQPPQAASVAEAEPAEKPADVTLTNEGNKPTPSKAALDRIAKGTAYFGSADKANDFITKNGLADTHTVEQTGKVRFDVKPKEQPNVADQRPQQQPASTEAVGQEADAGQAPAAVQPDAAQEVGPAEQAEPISDERKAMIERIRQADAESSRKVKRDFADANKRKGNVVIKDGKAHRLELVPRMSQGAKEPVDPSRIHVAYPDSNLVLMLDAGVRMDAPFAQTIIKQAQDAGFEVEGDMTAMTKPVTVTKAGAGATAIIIDPSATTLAGREPKLVKIRTAMGDNVHVRQSDLDGNRVQLPIYTADGNRKGGTVHRDNLDPNGEKQAQANAEISDNPFFDVITRKGGEPFDTKIAARREMLRQGLGATHGVVASDTIRAGVDGYVIKRMDRSEVTKPAAEIDTTAKPVEAPAKAAEQTTERWMGFEVVDAPQPGRFVVRESNGRGGYQKYATFSIDSNGSPKKVDHFFEAPSTREPVNKAIAHFIREKTEAAGNSVEQTATASQSVPAKSDPFAGNTLFTSDAVAKARARLKSKLNQLNSGFDPELAMDGMVIAGAYIESGVRKFSDYAKAMIDDLGPKVTPFLLSFYEAARNYPGLDTKGMTPVAEAKAEFDKLNAKPEPVTQEASKPIGQPVQAESMATFETALKAGDKVHYDYAGTDGSTVWIEPSGKGTGWVVKQKNDDSPEFTYTTGGNPMAGGYSRDEAVNRAKEIVAYRFNEWKPLAERNDNGPQELDQPGPRELAGEQPDAVQGTQPQRQAGTGAEGSRGADARGNVRAGGAGTEQPGRLGDDAGEVPAAAAGEGSGRGGQPGRRAVQRGERPAKPDPATGDRELGNQPELKPTDGTRAQDRADGFTITDADAIGEGGAKTKFKQNVAAIRLLKELTAANRQATRAEQAVLAKYVGWGGIPQAFERDKGEVSQGWANEVAELKALLTPEEMAAAAASTRNAHYTATDIVSAIWTALRHFGFKGGRVLEPSVGAGNFFGLMPGALRSASQLTGVELDHITGGIAKQLYPQANIQAPVGFQDFAAPDNYFDVATGNPPFGPEGIYDAIRRKISGFSIHNYFFAKSIDTVKPNGVLAMVVTNRLLDSAGDKARQYIAKRSEFLGAIRLPNNAFLKNAGTAVTTDIIFLRKLKDGEAPTGQSWMDVKQVTDKDGKTVPLNEYFVRNPDMMLGEFGAFGSMYRPDDAALVARPGQDTPALLAEAIAKLPQGFMDGPTAEPTRETIEPLTDISRVKVGSVFEQGGKIFERAEDMLGKQQAKEVTFASDKARDRVAGMIQVRDALIAVRGLQLTDGVSEKALESARAGLNKAYDAFVKANGPLNADANKRLMRDDPTWPQLAALEDGFDKGITAAVAKTTGEKARPASAKKAAIFTKRTQAPYQAPTKAASAKDALVSSLSERGRVDLDYMTELYGKTPEAIARELDGLIYEVVPGDFVTREEYLSGNVKKRLALTLQLAEKMPRFQKNVEALRAVQPADIEAVDIDVKTGAHWVPADVMEGFVAHITEGNRIKAVYNPITATWTLDAEQISNAAFTQYSTDRANIIKVLEAAANQKQIQVFDRNYDGTQTLNEAATTAANAKVDLVKSAWKNWIWADDARRTRLTRIYNDTFNTDVQREFDGSHLTFPGKVGDDIITLRPHQKNAVWRVIQSGTTLLDHVVGAGKTMAVIASVMEMRRMGLAKKPMLVVPNHLVGQWATDFMKLYPGANILAATKKDFEKDSRKKLFARIATGDWDAVIVAHSSFGKVEVEPEFQEQFIKQQIADMDVSISAMRAAEGRKSRNVKQIEKQKAALEEKLKRLFDTGSKDDNLYFSELGVDAVLLDEAHEFKNLGFSTGMQRVAGLGNPIGSNKAADMFMKVQSVLKRTGGRNVVFATGTPISNTMAEMYTMQRYLDYGTLKDQGIAHFDAWAKTFGEVVTDWELSPSGQYKMNSRFAKFVNMPELMQRYGSFADVINRDDINRQLAAQGKKLPVPKIKGGKPENTVVERSQDQARYIGIPTVDENGVESYPKGSLIWRSENLPKKAEKGADNMLKIMSDARKAALDMRLIDPSYPDNPNSKVNVAAGNIKAIYDKWTSDKGTQLVFIDLSTPKGAVAKEAAALRELVKLAEEGDEAAQEKLDAMSPDELLALDSSFSVYDDLKAKLIGLGIPENEVAFIHDANTELQKEELFAKVRAGRVRVLFGSTAKMGAGMNVQDRLVALHHLDAPWRPSDLEQREGRIIRQGNKLYEANPEGFEVEIKRYATKQTLDSRMWQTIEAKARFIEQVRKGTGQREVEDVAGEAANSAEMKAASSGNPLILEEMSLRQAIRKLENGQSEHNREQHRIKDQMRWVGESAKRADAEAAIMEADAPKAPKAFAVKVGSQTFDKHGEAGEAVLAAVDAMHASGEDTRDIGSYGRFALTVDDTSLAGTKKAVLTVKGQGEYQIEANPGSATTGLALRLQNTVKGLAEAAASSRAKAERYRADAPKLEAQIKPWGQEQELAEAKARHAAVIDQLKPKKKPADEAPAMSRAELEPIFEALEGRGLTRKRALDSLASMPEAARIQYIENNFFDILGDLEDSGKVSIKC